MSNLKFWLVAIVCSILPDADVISFALGIPYEAFWGHRGFTHSLLFALIIGVLATALFFRKNQSTVRMIGYTLFFTLSTASHSLLDAMTSGGLGVAVFSPWDNARYFLPWRPIKVSPIGVSNFFSEWGKKVIISELLWIGVPCSIYMVVVRIIKRW
jgi:inner membrane protein